MKIKLLIGALMLMIASANFVQAQTTSKKMLRHVVLFKFKDSATPAQVKEVEDAFRALPKKIKEIIIVKQKVMLRINLKNNSFF